MDRHALGVLEFYRIVELVTEKCVTPAGSLLAENMVPVAAAGVLRDLQDLLREVIGVLERDGRLPLEGAADLTGLLARASVDGAALDAGQLLQVLRSSRAADDTSSALSRKKDGINCLADLASGLEPLQPLQMAIARAISPEGEVLDSASHALAAVRSEIEATRVEVRALLDRHLQTLSLKKSLQDSIITLRNGRYVLPVKGGARGSVEGIVHDHSGSGATVFIEPIETVGRNNALARLHQEESREIRKVLQKLTSRVRECAGALSRNMEILADLDFLQAKGLACRGWRGTIPEVRIGGTIEIVQGRHPLLERTLSLANDKDSLVPLDLSYPDGIRSIVLTGPNTGGKTVALKTLGLFVLMAQSGLAIPAGAGTRLPLFDSVHADIGDEQSIDRSLSSFSAHLEQVVAILREAGENSLVLLDEIGAGTDPAEGSALAMALLEELHARGVTSLVTTHLGSLKVFVHDTGGMSNASMAFDRNALCPTYRLDVGLPGTSHALSIAERLGVDPKLIQRARENLGSSEMEMGKLLADLKSRGAEMDWRLEELSRDQADIEQERIDLVSRERMLRSDRRELKAKALGEAKRYLDESRALVERHVKEIREQGGERESIRSARQEIERERRNLRARLDELEGTDETPGDTGDILHIGQAVRIASMEKTGFIVEEGNRAGRYYVETGGIRLEIDSTDLSPARDVGKRKAKPVSHSLPAKTVRLQLDLRGMTAEEARDEVDKFLDDAVLSGASTVEIIHGIGTGVLRREVGVMLRCDPRIRRFELAHGRGASVAEMND